MAMWLKQSTAVDISVGPFVDSSDGVTPETGLTITQPDIRLKKAGGAWAQKNAAQTLSHEENGWYEIALDTTDTNTLGNLLVAVNESGALPVWREFQVVPANVWDSLFGADKLQVHVDEMTAGIITAAVIATGAVDADALAADAAAEIADAVWDEDATAHQTQGTFGQGLGDSAAGGVSIRSLIGTPNVDLASDIAAIDTDVGAILVDTNEIQVDWADVVIDVADIKAKTDQLTFTTPNVVDAGTADPWATDLPGEYGAGEAGFIVAGIKTKADLIPGTQDGKTFAEHVVLQSAALMGSVSGFALNTPQYKGIDDVKVRISGTTSADGRSGITLDAT
jgi:hypothetical protein